MDDRKFPRKTSKNISGTGSWGAAFKKNEKKRDPFDPLDLLTPDSSLKRDEELPHIRSTWATLDIETGHRTWSGERENVTENPARPVESSFSYGSREPHGIKDASDEFLAVTELLQSREGPRSDFERRNISIAKADSGPVKVVIGEAVKTVNQIPDTRGQYMNEQGEYLDGVNRGRMRKRLEDERRSLIARRNEEVDAAKAKKRAWDALSPEAKEEEATKKRRAEHQLAAYRSGLMIDVREYTNLPERYRRKTRPGLVSDWKQKMSLRDVSGGRFNSVDPSTATAPRIFQIDDTSLKPTSETDQQGLVNRAQELCLERGRLVLAKLDKLVQFSPEAISRRLFGGQLQEIRFFPDDKMAIIVFVLPMDAEGFIQHVKSAEKNDATTFRALQICASWHRGNEQQAIWPSQPNILQWILSGATRCLEIIGIDKHKKPEDFAKDVACGLGKRPVKVAIIHSTKRYVQSIQGNSGMIEFSSIKDAVESRQQILEKKAPGFDHCRVEFLGDPTDTAPVRREYCHCKNCKKNLGD